MADFVSKHFPLRHWHRRFPTGWVEEFPDGRLRPVGGWVLSGNPERAVQGRPDALDLQPGVIVASMYEVQRMVFQVSAALETLHELASADEPRLTGVHDRHSRIAVRIEELIGRAEAVERNLSEAIAALASATALLRDDD
jgi:hypothetical protein